MANRGCVEMCTNVFLVINGRKHRRCPRHTNSLNLRKKYNEEFMASARLEMCHSLVLQQLLGTMNDCIVTRVAFLGPLGLSLESVLEMVNPEI